MKGRSGRRLGARGPEVGCCAVLGRGDKIRLVSAWVAVPLWARCDAAEVADVRHWPTDRPTPNR